VSCRKDNGRAFHTRGPATLKLLSLKLAYVRGTSHVLSYADQNKQHLGFALLLLIGCQDGRLVLIRVFIRGPLKSCFRRP